MPSNAFCSEEFCDHPLIRYPPLPNWSAAVRVTIDTEALVASTALKDGTIAIQAVEACAPPVRSVRNHYPLLQRKAFKSHYNRATPLEKSSTKMTRSSIGLRNSCSNCSIFFSTDIRRDSIEIARVSTVMMCLVTSPCALRVPFLNSLMLFDSERNVCVSGW